MTGIAGFESLVPWLPKFHQLKFGEQISMIGNGQSLPLFGALAILSWVGAELNPVDAPAKEAEIGSSSALSNARICFV